MSVGLNSSISSINSYTSVEGNSAIGNFDGRTIEVSDKSVVPTTAFTAEIPSTALSARTVTVPQNVSL